MAGVAATNSIVTPGDGYRLWAQSYDHEPNPMLSLERRILLPLLPPLKGWDVVDLGCGTGRWLELARDAGAKSLLGVDLSPEMLDHARSKLGAAASFVCADCADAQIPNDSADLVLCNFVLSYIQEPEHLLNLASRILRPGGSLVLTDVHPETAAAFHWRRGCQVHGEHREIFTRNRAIAEVIEFSANANLELVLRLEPRFGEEDRILFERSGKREYFDKIQTFPAIYILQCSPTQNPAQCVTRTPSPGEIAVLQGVRLALGPLDTLPADLRLANSQVSSISSAMQGGSDFSSGESSLDLRGYLLLPGLINAHDHLEFALFPRLGSGGYRNFLEWADEIHHSHASLIALHRQVPREVRLWWGGIRNLLCGATSVCHHNPYESTVFDQEFVVRILEEFGWAHSLSLEPDFAAKKAATPEGKSFFIHLAEGIDEQSAGEIFELHRAQALDANTTIIHGIGMDATGKDLLRAAGAGLIWCPSSNAFLFGKTFSSDDLRDFPKVALGSDSPLTAQGDLLDELRFAHRELKACPGDLYAYVTRQPAGLLRLANGEGTLRVQGVADLIAVRDRGATPAETLAAMSHVDVELVLLGGRVRMASSEILQRLPAHDRVGLQPLAIEGVVRWIWAPLDWLFHETQKHLGNEIALGGKQVRFGK